MGRVSDLCVLCLVLVHCSSCDEIEALVPAQLLTILDFHCLLINENPIE